MECFNEAAGIPRGRHVIRLAVREVFSPASMRPRVFPAEDASLSVIPASAARSGFNEAAGIPRGRRGNYAIVSATPERLQ